MLNAKASTTNTNTAMSTTASITTRFDRKAIMTAAWVMIRQGQTKSAALKAAWAAAKAPAVADSSWAVEIVRSGLDLNLGGRRRRLVSLTADEQGRSYTVSSITAVGGDVTVTIVATQFADCAATFTVSVSQGEEFDPYNCFMAAVDQIGKAVAINHGAFAAARI